MDGSAHLAGALDVDGPVSIAGAAELYGTLNVLGGVTMHDTLAISAAISSSFSSVVDVLAPNPSYSGDILVLRSIASPNTGFNLIDSKVGAIPISVFSVDGTGEFFEFYSRDISNKILELFFSS